MAITLPDDLQRDLEAEVKAGRAKSVDAFVAHAARTQLKVLADFRRSLDEAEEDYRINGGIPWETVKAELADILADAGDD